ncbi:exopolysaccharide biosynthesis polyprenyl glycosylphosphotransferase [Polaribacter glomeratus]|uniref:Undecaprenyl-phosphate glucose phosphotransferase n=1 Tax=Polaribacter glomeratus TaxID=102 RepID=A0A2S7WHW8_9FLAO|nr:exopolysaccharide biosynthesis polyprenyl glycosylphosphotransferase [Polaribacter glomeratus]PQJ77194.1 undecaprenyl-phosphate glucose phosphotransferase [Polaribacter glomeratus]TXD65156.1 exopolysaccharide biosynthesis polyprenyl glycosylphosphotransferase [Polaribacter glomeratus]
MKHKKSILIRVLIILIDLLVINVIVYILFDKIYLNFTFLTYISISWVVISLYTGYYKVHRYTQVNVLLSLIVSQFFVFLLAYLSFFSLFMEGESIKNQFLFFGIISLIIPFLKFFIYFMRKRYRAEGNNHRNVVYFGEFNSAKKLENLFQLKNHFGYRYIGFFSSKIYDSEDYLGHLKSGFKYIEEHEIDEMYCDPSEISPNLLVKIRKFAEEKDLELILMPENNAIYRKDFVLEYLGTVPILKPKRLPFEKIETHIIKRILDIICSAFICVFILTWMLPILWIVIRIDSKGPLFFKQRREGINGTQFLCYKLRSMKVNNNADKVSASKNDTRITKVGAFLRKSSLDEFPQFFNVLLGDMSIVGPRPHMNLHTKKYINEVDNYLLRNSVKPGITGLAQISGYRGEVIKKSDINNRVRLDIFYIENWSFFLDIKIIAQTFFNVFIKEDKAY